MVCTMKHSVYNIVAIIGFGDDMNIKLILPILEGASPENIVRLELENPRILQVTSGRRYQYELI